MRKFISKTIFIKLMLNLIFFAQAEGQDHIWGDWKKWGDIGDNRFENPVLPMDYSDIDCIRVDTDYYAISSTLQFSPGLVILHSKDMVNWSVLGHAVHDLRQISAGLNWDKMNQYGRGIWAGAIRFHNKKFWIYFGTPDEGYFMTTADNPSGPWSPLYHVLNEKGWDDCCPFWDEDGQGYLVGTNFQNGYEIHLFKLSSDGKSLIGGSDKIIHRSNGSEANKLYKIDVYYYHLFSEEGQLGRALMMERSKNIWGPYNEIKQLSYAQKEFNEPNQGGLVQTKEGKWFFLTHHGTGDWSGRVVSLLPVTWINGWPIIGKAGQEKIGRMVWSDQKPVKTNTVLLPQTSDDFSGNILSEQWEWNYQPRSDKWSLNERDGWLRLYAFKPIDSVGFFKAGNTLTQRSIRTATNEVIIKLDVSGMADGQKAGLSHFGFPEYSAIGVICNDNKKNILFELNGHLTFGPVLKNKFLWLKSIWGLRGRNQNYYSLDGKYFVPFGKSYQMVWGAYRGDRIAIYNYNMKRDSGYIDADYFHYKYSKSK